MSETIENIVENAAEGLDQLSAEVQVTTAAEDQAAANGAILNSTTFWVAVALIIFLGLVGKKVWGAVTGMLDDRAEAIRNELEEARKIREDASVLLANYQRKQKEALAESEAIIATAKEEADRMRAEAEKDVETSLRRREEQAMAKIAQAEQAALSELRNVTVDAAMQASKKVLSDKMDAKLANGLIDKSISDLSDKLN